MCLSLEINPNSTPPITSKHNIEKYAAETEPVLLLIEA